MLKKKILAWVTTVSVTTVMLLGGSVAAFADDTTSGVTAEVEVSAQSELSFSMAHKKLKVNSTLSDQYGYEDKVPATKVSALDALIAAHIDKYGADKATVNKELVMSAGNPTKSMGAGGSGKYSGYAVNEGFAFQEGSTTTGAMVNEAALKDGDRVDFFWYEDEYWADTVTVFQQDGKKVFNVDAVEDQDFTLDLVGFMFMGGYQDQTLKGIEDANILILDKDGNATDYVSDAEGNPVATDEDGSVTMSLPEGTYYLTAEKGEGEARLVMPYVKVNVKGVEKLTLSMDRASVDVNDTVKLEATLKTASSDKAITWTSDDEDVATVKDGVVTGVAPGKTTITASNGDLEETCVVKVSEPKVKLNKKTLSLDQGEEQELTASLTSNNKEAKVAWESSDEKVATVSKGVVTAKTPGTAVITATYGDAEASCIVTVTKAEAPTKFAVVETSNKLMKREGNYSMYAYASLEKEDTLQLAIDAVEPETASQKVTWSSNNKSFPIDENGKVSVPEKITSSAYVTFTATSKVNASVKATMQLYFLPPMTLEFYDSANRLKYIQIPENGVVNGGTGTCLTQPSQYRDYDFLNFTSEDESMITVNEKGNLYAKKPGVAKITASLKSNPSVKQTIEVEIKGFFIKNADGKTVKDQMEVGKTQQLTAADVEGTATWTSSNEEVATVDESGKVTAKAAGQTIITATVGSQKASYEMNVAEAGKVYPERLYTNSYNNLYTSQDYKTSLKGSFTYLAEGDTSSTNVYSFPVTDTKEQTYFMKESTSAKTVSMGAVFDSETMKVEILTEDGKTTALESKKTSSVSIQPGDNTFKVKVTSLKDEKNTTEYTFHVKAANCTNNAISSITLKPSNRALNTQKTYKLAGFPRANGEGTLYRMDGSGNFVANKATGFNAATTEYQAYLYGDAKDVAFTVNPRDTVSAHIAYSFDEGKTWKEGTGKVVTPATSFDASGKADCKVKIVDDAAYKAAKAEEKDAFADEALQVYTIHVERLSKEFSEKTQLEDIIFDENCMEGTPNFEKGATMAAAVVAHEADEVTLKFVANKDVSVYKAANTAAANLLSTEATDEKGNKVYELKVATPLKQQGNTISQSVNVVYTDEAGNVLTEKTSISLYKRGTTYGTLVGTPDKIADYLCVGSQYTSGGNTGWGVYGIFPEKIFMDAGNWSTCISLGNFGGYMTLYYDDPIVDDPHNKYGIDFTVFGNSNGGASFAEPGNVLVSEDGEHWYALAGSEHYDPTTRWDYEVTYKKSDNEIADYEDNDGNAGSLGAGWSPYRLPTKNCYPLYHWTDEDKVTVKGVRLYSPVGSKGDGIENTGAAALPAFGYSDVHTNSKTVAGTGEDVNLITTPVGNPYAEKYDGYGDGFDLKWAVDSQGNPVDVSNKKFHYVKVQTASFINGGVIGEKSTEISTMVRTRGEKTEVGETKAPAAIKVGDKTLNLKEGQNTYYAPVEADKEYKVSVDTEGDTNVYINNQRTKERDFTGMPDKGIVRVILQNGDASPAIYYIHMVEKAETPEYVNALVDTANEKADWTEAKAAYDKLSDEDKSIVRDTEGIQKEASAQQVANAEELIENIGTVNSDSAKAIEAARKAYDALSDAQKEEISGYQTLVNAEATLKNIKLQEKIAKLEKNAAGNEKELAETKLAATTMKVTKKVTYTGKAKKPSVTLKFADRKLVKGKDYSVTYKNNKNVGKATVIVKGLGEFAGTKSATFQIIPKKTTVKRIDRTKTTINVKWKKVAKASGYQVMYSTSKNFKSGKKTVTVKKNTASKKVKNLKSKKKYYVKVRTYKTVKGVKYYSNWSKMKSVRTK